MKAVRILSIAVAMMVMSLSSFAQVGGRDVSGGSFTLSFMGLNPMGDFASTSTQTTSLLLNNGCGNATLGAGFGMKFGYNFKFGLGIVLSADGFWNQLNGETRAMYDNISKTKPNYINVPVLLGLNYEVYFGKVFGIYVDGSAGVNMLFLTQEGWKDKAVKYKSSTSFAWQVGGGILLGANISLGVHYYDLGEASIVPMESSTLVSILGLESSVHEKVLALRLGLIF